MKSTKPIILIKIYKEKLTDTEKGDGYYEAMKRIAGKKHMKSVPSRDILYTKNNTKLIKTVSQGLTGRSSNLSWPAI